MSAIECRGRDVVCISLEAGRMMKFLPKMCKKMEAYAVRNGNLFLLTCVMHFCCNVSAVAFFGELLAPHLQYHENTQVCIRIICITEINLQLLRLDLFGHQSRSLPRRV